MQLNDETINFDVKRIKVTVTTHDPIETNNFPVVRLKRLSKSVLTELTKFRSANAEENTIKPKTSSTVLSSTSKKRKSEIPSRYMTRSKKPKLTDEMSVPTSESDVFINSENVTINSSSQNEQQTESIAIMTNEVAHLEFKINEVVWGKLRGWPHWPAKIMAIEQRRYEIYWFNDHRKSKVFRSQMFKFHDNFVTFSKKFNSSISLETAAKEALMYLSSTSSKN